jgi:23S rRNA pseudouridine1911/1915/1917 synthase
MDLLARLRAAYPESSGRSVREWLRAGRVRLNGRVARDGRTPVDPGDRVALGPVPPPVFPPALRRVHEDDTLVVVDKPAGLLTIATERERHRTAYRLLWDYLAAGRPPRRPFIVHRLDRETSGLVVFAKSAAAKRHLQAQFEGRTAERVYVAVVEGAVAEDRGTLTSTLVEDRGLRVRPVHGESGRRRPGSRAPRRAITHYRALARGPHATLLELTLGTGRRHQLRVQLAEIGHPIVGDPIHGSRRNPLGRLGLHATRLQLVHPASGARVVFHSPVPAGFRHLAPAARDLPLPARP